MNSLRGVRITRNDSCMSWRQKSRNSGLCPSFLVPGKPSASIKTHDDEGDTLWDCQEPDWHKGIMMGTVGGVLDVSRGEVERMKLILSGGISGQSLVAAKEQWHQHGSMSFRILTYSVLECGQLGT